MALLALTHDCGRAASPPTQPALSNHESVVAPASNSPSGANLDWIKVGRSQKGFVAERSGRKFIPWGFNYDRDYKMRLIEDYWDVEWRTVMQDFREMKNLGANVVRLHLSFGKFMDGPDQPNQKALERMALLVKLAEETGLYLDVTGLGCYRKADIPGWYDAMSETERWQAQSRFWEALARCCRSSPAIFCYDLMNEPIVPQAQRPPKDWMAGELAGYSYVQFISLDQAGRPRPEIARQWIAQLVSAIRRQDSRHLVTVGLLPNSLETPVSASGFPPQKIAEKLDFICVHIYPKSGKLNEDLKLLRGFRAGKPVVIEEIFPLDCQMAELRQFLERSRKGASGWITFYWGQTPEELSQLRTPAAALMRASLELFRELNPN